jgi:hypothetical protein
MPNFSSKKISTTLDKFNMNYLPFNNTNFFSKWSEKTFVNSERSFPFNKLEKYIILGGLTYNIEKDDSLKKLINFSLLCQRERGSAIASTIDFYNLSSSMLIQIKENKFRVRIFNINGIFSLYDQSHGISSSLEEYYFDALRKPKKDKRIVLQLVKQSYYDFINAYLFNLNNYISVINDDF